MQNAPLGLNSRRCVFFEKEFMMLLLFTSGCSYYLDYQNRRADHVNALWGIIDWNVVGSRMK